MSSATTTEPKCSHPRAIRPRSATCADFALAVGLKHPAAGPGERERQIAQRVSNGTLTGEARIALAVGAVWNRYKVKKHFALQITDDSFTYSRKAEQIAAEAALDGSYALRAGQISTDELAAAGIVRAYKQLKEAEKGFGTIKNQRPARGCSNDSRPLTCVPARLTSPRAAKPASQNMSWSHEQQCGASLPHWPGK